MEFYIRTNNEWVLQPLVVAPELTTTFDETLDSFNCVLPITNDDTPIEPDTLCKIVIENKTYLFIVAVDEVQLVSKSSLKYQHHLSLVQNTRLLSKHLVRNTVFSQPARRYETSWTYTDSSAFDDDNFLNFATLDYKRKIDNKCKIFIKFVMVQSHSSTGYNDYNFTTLNDFEFNNEVSTTNWIRYTDNDYVYIHIVYNTFAGAGGEEVITLKSKDITFNKEIELSIPANISNAKEIAVYATYSGDYQLRPIPQITNEYSINEWCLHLISKIQTYYYTMYDVIDTLRKQQAQDDLTHTNQKLFEMPDDINLFNLLKSTIAPNFTFTGTTMYDCLAEIFKFYDATFTLDENNVLGIEYLNEYKENINKDFSDKMVSIREDDYNQRLVNVFENALVEETIYTLPKASGLGTIEQSDWAFVLPHDIQEVLSFELFIPAGSVGTLNTNGFYFDFTNYVVEQNLYSSLVEDSNQSATTLKKQHTCFPYSGNQIHLGINLRRWAWAGQQPLKYWFYRNFLEYMFKPRNASTASGTYLSSLNYSKLKIRVKYLANVGGRIKIENDLTRYKGELQVNQGQGRVDVGKLGLNILGLSTKLGNPTLSLTQKHTSWADRIKKGDIYTYNGEKWLANTVKYVFYNDFIQTNIDFVKNYNALSSRVQVDREKRLSNISGELATKAEENYTEYVYVRTFLRPVTETADDLALSRDKIYSFIAATFGCDFSYSNNVDFATIETYYNNNSLIANSIYIPTIKYGAGNTLCIEMGYDSAISAGVSTEFKVNNGGYTSSVNYTDDSGWADYVTFAFCSFTNNSFSYRHPYIQSNEKIEIGKLEKYRFYKKPNEILSFNYQITFLPQESGTIIGNEFINKNGLVNGLQNKKLYIYYSYSEKYSIFDKKGKGTPVEVTNITASTLSGNVLRLFFEANGVWRYEVIKSVAICDENGNVYIASNNNVFVSTSISFDIYFITKHNRIN